MKNKLKQLSAVVGVILMLGTLSAPATASAPPDPEYAPMATLTAVKPWKSGKTVYYAASAGATTSLKASLRWQITGPDQTLQTVSKVGTYVSGSKICDWGIPRDRILYTTAKSTSGTVHSATLWTTSSGNAC